MARPVLVLIPGIGDRSRAYGFFAWVWHMHGFDVHVIPFGWSHYHADITAKTREFMRQLERLGQDKLYVIGISAGGPAAINVYAEKPSVARVITVCSPLESFPHAIENRLLQESILRANDALEHFSPEEKGQILSVYGLYDQVVPAVMSRYEGIRTYRVPAVWHAIIIFAAMTFASFRLSRFLKKGK